MTTHATTRSATETPSRVIGVAPKWLGALGLTAGIGAVVASSCCTLPLVLGALGASAGVLGGLQQVAEWRVPFLVVSALGMAGGWAAWWWKPPTGCAAGSACASPARSRATLALLVFATAVLIAAASWDRIDPMMLRLLRGR